MNDDPIPLPAPPSLIELTIAQTQDVSARVQEIMRRLDRLPAGTYELTITKQDVRAQPWIGSILRVEKIETFSISKYQAE